jgi:hypothetical protein
MGWYESPDEIKRKRELAVLMIEQEKLEKQKIIIQTLKSDYPKLFDYIDENIVDFEKSISYDTISEEIKKNESQKSN